MTSRHRAISWSTWSSNVPMARHARKYSGGRDESWMVLGVGNPHRRSVWDHAACTRGPGRSSYWEELRPRDQCTDRRGGFRTAAIIAGTPGYVPPTIVMCAPSTPPDTRKRPPAEASGRRCRQMVIPKSPRAADPGAEVGRSRGPSVSPLTPVHNPGDQLPVPSCTGKVT